MMEGHRQLRTRALASGAGLSLLAESQDQHVSRVFLDAGLRAGANTE